MQIQRHHSISAHTQPFERTDLTAEAKITII